MITLFTRKLSLQTRFHNGPGFTRVYRQIFSALLLLNALFFSSKTYAQDDLAPVANAGPDQTICDGESILLAGSFGGSATSGTFYLISPEGILLPKGLCPPPANCNFQLGPPPSILGATTPAVQTYIFVTDDPPGPYGPATDTMIVTINPRAIADAGADQAICAGSSVTLNGSFGGAATSGSFNGGDGTFSGNVYTPGAADIAAGSVTLAYTTDDPPGPCAAASDVMTITINHCAPFCTYTQDFYGKVVGRTCEDGIVLVKKLIAASINNMPGQQLYLGAGMDSLAKGGSFTATANQADILNRLLPGLDDPELLVADYNLSKARNFPPLKRERIQNTLLSQSITLALNIYRTTEFNVSVGNILLKNDWLVTRKKAISSDCLHPDTAACANDSGAIQSWQLPHNVLFAMGGANRVVDLLTMAGNALGGQIAKGVTLEDITSAVTTVNNAFDGCRYLVGFYPCAKTCANLNLRCPLAGSEIATNVSSKIILNRPVTLKVKAYPNPYGGRVTFTIESQSSGNASLDIYDMIGQKVETVYSGHLIAGKSRVIEYKIPDGNRKNLIYILKADGQQVSGKLIHGE